MKWFEFYFLLAGRYLAGRKLRTTLTTLGIVFGVTLTFGLNSLGPAFEAVFKRNLESTGLQIDLLITQETYAVFDDSVLEKVAAVPGVVDVSGSLGRDIFLPEEFAFATPDGELVTTLSIHSLDAQAGLHLFEYVLAEGRELVAGRGFEAGDGDVVLISEEMSAAKGLDIGDMLRLPSAGGVTKLEIIGILAGRGPAIGEERLYMTLSAAQRLFNSPGLINGIIGQFEEGVDEVATRQAVLEALGSGYQIGELQGGAQAWEAVIQIASIVFMLFGVLALALAGFIMFNTFRTMVLERKRDIGMLRAIGSSKRTIRWLFLTESLLQGVMGTAFGLLTGFLLAKSMQPLFANFFDIFMHTPFGQPIFKIGNFAISILLGIGIPLLSTWLPVREASRVTPLEALRPSMGEVNWGGAGRRRLYWGSGMMLFSLSGLISGNLGLSAVGVLLFLAALIVLGPFLVLPISNLFGGVLALLYTREGQIAQGNLARQPGRATITASTLAICLAILIALAGMATSTTRGMLAYLEDSMRADFLLLPESLIFGSGNVGAEPELAQSIAAIPGVTQVTTLRSANGQIGDVGLTVIGVNPETYPQISGLIILEGDPSLVYEQLASGRKAVVSGVYATASGVEVGDIVVVQSANGSEDYEVVGIGFDYLNAKAQSIYISQENLANDFNEYNDVLVMVNAAEGLGSSELQADFQELIEKYPAFNLYSFETLKESQMRGIQAQQMGMMLVVVFLAIPALLALANTLAINVLERTREIGVMRAVGATRRQVRRIVLAESLLLSAMGVAFGCLSGIWLGYVLVGALTITGLPLPYFFPYTGILIAVAVGLLIGIIAASIPASKAARLEILSALAYE